MSVSSSKGVGLGSDSLFCGDFLGDMPNFEAFESKYFLKYVTFPTCNLENPLL